MTSRTVVALVAVALLAPAARAHASGAIVLDEIRGPIQVVVAGHVARAVAHADAEGAALLVFSMDTPGGDVSSTRDIIQSILASRTPVVVFVGPSGARAASAGFYIAFAADVAAMAPGTQIGAAHPVTPFGQNTKDDIMLQKVENDLAAQARTIAQNRKRNADLAEKIVRDSVSVTETEALDQHLIDYVAHDLEALLAELDGKTIRRFDGVEIVARTAGVPREPFEMTRRERLLGAIADPNVAIVLLVVGLLGLYVEFTHPGVIAPGVIGGVSLFLFALATQILPLNLLGLILIGAGIGLFVVEIKVASFGLLTAGGVFAVTLGFLILFDGPIPEMRVQRAVVLPIALTLAGIMAFLTYRAVASRRWKVTTGPDGLVGEIGTALTEVGAGGRVFVHGEYWSARAAEPIPAGTKVRVRSLTDMVVEVERA
ncbi:MAG: nodulation protein NfeD [Acidobacteria bacterium]|nr:nodulation protein NfeD [Acidobacteriota bacterium]